MVSHRQFVLNVIETYKKLECLWKTSDPNYNNKNKRNAALDKLVILFKTKYPSATKDFVSKKLISMQGSFQKELDKIQASKKSGTGQVHVPKLWYYDKLQFLEDQKISSQSTSECWDEEASGDENITPSSSKQESLTPTQGNFKRSRCKTNQVLHKRTKRNKMTIKKPAKQKYDSFGEHVAEKLRALPPRMVPICEKLISDIIFFAERNILNVTSQVVTEYVMPKPLGRVNCDTDDTVMK